MFFLFKKQIELFVGSTIKHALSSKCQLTFTKHQINNIQQIPNNNSCCDKGILGNEF